MRRVTVGVLTYHRADTLLPLLAELCRQVVELSGRDGYAVSVLVVDNDPAGGAADVVSGFPAVRHVVEPRPGIAAARNRVLAETADDDLLVFVDDDELPVPRWLDHLLTAQEATGAQLVAGPVVSRLPDDADPWVLGTDVFQRRRMPTGTGIAVAATNNIVLERRWLADHGLVFDERFGTSGGEDTMLTRTMASNGARMVWCDEAVVTDVVPAARATRSWVLRRAYSSGNGWVVVDTALAADASGRRRARIRGAVQGLLRVGGGLLVALTGLATRSHARSAAGQRTVARGAGMLAGAVGSVYLEYRRPDATR